jgi:ribosomal-protein-alanine N-acetyltransferase
MTGRATTIRLIAAGDAGQIATHLSRDASDFARWDPAQPAEYYTPGGQEKRIGRLLNGYRDGVRWPGAILAGDEVVGQVTVSDIIRGPFLKASVGYWVAVPFRRQGHAAAAVRMALRVMADELGLHRVEARTQVENLPSHQVLRKNGFSTCGVAHAHSFINGEWRDGILWELVLHDAPPQ